MIDNVDKMFSNMEKAEGPEVTNFHSRASTLKRRVQQNNAKAYSAVAISILLPLTGALCCVGATLAIIGGPIYGSTENPSNTLIAGGVFLGSGTLCAVAAAISRCCCGWLWSKT